MAALSHAEAESPRTGLGTVWLDTLSRPGWAGKAAPLYSQDARSRGPSEGSIVHLLQVGIFLELPVGKDGVLSGVHTFMCHQSRLHGHTFGAACLRGAQR